MITRQHVSDKLIAYLNGEITLAAWVDWAENAAMITDFGPEEDIPLLADVVTYLAAADTAPFPLTWEICTDFLTRLGRPVRVVPALE
jgi:hypothetical protein